MSWPGWRRRLVVAAALAGGLSGAACAPLRGADASTDSLAGTTITFSASVTAAEKPALEELLTRFEDQSRTMVNLDLLSHFRDRPTSRVKLLASITAPELIHRLEVEVPQGKPSIQLFAQDNLALKPLVDQRLVEDLSGVAVPRAVTRSLVPPRLDGRQFFLPFRPNVRLAYAEIQRLRQAGVSAPTTVSELRDVAERLKAAEGRPAVTLSLGEGDPAAVTLSEWIVSFGGNPVQLDDPGSVQAFQSLRQLWKDGLLARESLFAKFDTEVDNLRTGVAALAQNWSFTSAQLAKAGALRRFEVYPGWTGPVRAAHVIGGDVLGIPRGVKGKQRQAAVALAQFLMSKQAQTYLVRQNAWPSIRSDAYAKVPDAQRQTFRAIQQALSDGWFRPSVSYWPEVSKDMNEAVDRILLQDQPVRPVLDELHADVAQVARQQGAQYP